MARHVTRYEREQTASFEGFVEMFPGAGALVAGRVGSAALLSRIDTRGDVIWEKRYRFGEGPIRFLHGVRCPNGDFLLYGVLRVGEDRWHLVVRVEGDGTVVWSRAYRHENTRFARRLVHGAGENYFFTGWHNHESSLDSVELFKIDGAGNLRHACLFGDSGDDQVATMLPFGTGCLIVGETSAGSGWDGFVASFQADLTLQRARLVGGPRFDTVQSVARVGSIFMLTGLTTPAGGKRASSSYIVPFSMARNTARGYRFDLFPGVGDGGLKKLVHHGDRLYLLARDSKGNESLVFQVRAPTLSWGRRLHLDGGRLLDLAADESGLFLCGDQLDGEGGRTALFAETGLGLESCRTRDVDLPQLEALEFRVRDWAAKTRDLGEEVRVVHPGVWAEPVKSRRKWTCAPTTVIEFGDHTLVQSPYLTLQAAGSDTTDHSTRGVHLRWELGRDLGERHLPKGDLAAPEGPFPSTLFFNRSNDFVRLYRTEFEPRSSVRLDFRRPPAQVVESGAVREWIWRLFATAGSEARVLTLRFLDRARYDILRSTLTPAEEPLEFMTQYDGVFELTLVDHLSFQVDLHGLASRGTDPRLRLEVVSRLDGDEAEAQLVTCRQEFVGGELGISKTIVSENIETLRLELRDLGLSFIDFTTYIDTLAQKNVNGGDWVALGTFGLSLDSAEVFARLEGPSPGAVDGRWPRFNESDQTTGAFTVQVANYRDKWRPQGAPEDGVEEAVRQYLERSRSDEKALASLPSDQEGDEAHLDVSYLDLLRLISVDFHLARMLGLGHIDAQGSEVENRRFLYLAEYITEVALEEGEEARKVQHLAMSLPTGQRDHRLPAAPVLLPPRYGLTVENATLEPTVLTLEGGYDRFADVRYVKLFKEPAEQGQRVGAFFADPEIFCLAAETPPVLYGVEYREVSEGTWRRPEIASDPEYQDGAGLAEVEPLPDSGEVEQPIFLHRETEEGVHRYALYAINWFSRVSPLSQEVATDRTEFPKRSAPLAPLGFTAHLIQKEDPRIFTTTREQTMLAALSGDQTLVRVTFDWNHVHHQAYQFADRIEFFFREQAPRVVRGLVQDVTPLPSGRLRVATTSFQIASLNPPQSVQPIVLPQEALRFVGGLLTAGETSCVIEDVLQTDAAGHDPIFLVAALKETTPLDLDQENEFLTVEDFVGPRPGDRFLALENLDIEAHWDTRLAKSVPVDVLDRTHRETTTTSDGTPIERVMGGVFEKAKVTSIREVDEDGQSIPGTRSGYYRVRFDNYQLPALADPDVEWYQGTVRIVADPAFPPSEPGRRDPLIKVLQVLEIDRGSRLKLVVYDAEIESGPDYVPIRTGAGVEVNFHPSYRVYLRAEAGTQFNAEALLPSVGEGSRQTFLGARSIDTGADCASPITARAPLVAQELVEPEAPEEPSGPLYATRPDFYGKSTYTFDVGVNITGRKPYSLVFYRADERRILETLYKPATIYDPETGILARLAALEALDAGFEQNRWRDLANVEYDAAEKRFKAYVAAGYRFPIPDNDAYQVPHHDARVDDRPFDGVRTFGDSFSVTLNFDPLVTESRDFARLVADAIDGAFLPLTEQPVIYKYLASGNSTSGRKPVLRDDLDRLLPPDHPDFDPFPMAVTRSGGAMVRFTDYTLDGASRRLFFYCAVELSNRLQPSDRSPIAGPVRLVNTAPPEEPGIKKVTTRLADPLHELGAAVRFEVNPYIESEEVTKIEIYRTLDAAAALAVRTMDLVGTVGIDEEIVDEFEDLLIPPFGEALFYRLVAVREIVNEKGEAELVRSKPSRTLLASVVDNLTPQAPQIRWESEPLVSGPPAELPRVVLSWPRTCYQGTYYLFRMTSAGNWTLVYQIQSNEEEFQYPPLDGHLPDFTNFPETARLVKEDEDGRPLYHRFKVDVENASGLLNREEKALTI